MQGPQPSLLRELPTRRAGSSLGEVVGFFARNGSSVSLHKSRFDVAPILRSATRSLIKSKEEVNKAVTDLGVHMGRV